ncbi:hypothetical protein [Pseudomonas sp. Irchel 3E13]|uniref:hypothetical protein n=1 Tax=Pseudomonas sp. Irchel 3E13 TaxID=2008975 RepID=UPI00117AC8D2|nr:hypothetical protein [Pseudomonas sp. Irchel 3E13]
MQSLLKKRIEKLSLLRNALLLTMAVYWAGLVWYFPLAPGETILSSSLKCGTVIALLLTGFVTRWKPSTKAVCANSAILIGLLINPLNWEATSGYENWISIPAVAFFIASLLVEARRFQLSRYSDLRLS